MTKRSLCLVVLQAVVGFAGHANAALFLRGDGLVYDDDLNVTWMQNADFFHTGTQAKSWEEASALVSSLTFQGIDGWRLPTTPGTGEGFLNEGEFGHLYYSELGNVAGGIPFNAGPFFNIQGGRYWTATPSDSQSAFAFYINPFEQPGSISGLQDADLKTHGNNIWAVHDGDIGNAVPAVPEPASVAIWGMGALAFAVGTIRRRFARVRSRLV